MMSSSSLSSPTKQSLGHYQVIRPDTETPWSVDIVSVIPKVVLDGAAGSLRRNYVTGKCAAGRWSCVGITTTPTPNNSMNNGTNNSTNNSSTGSQDHNIVFYVWNTPPNTALADQKNKLPVLKLTHRKIQMRTDDNDTDSDSDMDGMDADGMDTANNDQNANLLLAMEVSPVSPDIVYLYVLQPVTGVLVLWKLSLKDLSKVLEPPAKFVLFLDLLDNEVVTSLTVHWKPPQQNQSQQHQHQHQQASPLIVVGTNQGRVIWVVQTHVPIALHAQTADPNANATGLLTRLWKTVQYQETAPIAAILPITTTSSSTSSTTANAEKEFCSVSIQGKIVHWKVTPSEAHKAFFQAQEKFQLLGALKDYLYNRNRNRSDGGTSTNSSTNISSPPDLYDLQVQRAALQADGSTLHVLVLTSHADDESRLYWIRLTTVDTESDSNSHGMNLQLQHAVWLNRFVSPASVDVAGWLVADNGVAYGAFVQDPSLPAIIMALDEHDGTGTAHEVDLPVDSVQSVLKDTLTKDIVTHGCSVLTESGTGLRVRLDRANPPATGAGGVSTSTKSSSSSNPATVTTLSTHLRSVFWEFYQNPDRNTRLPPSLAVATSADLEQAVMAVAVLLKDKGDVSSMQNPTEWHMAFINLLQQQGLYRSLSVNCRWFLLGIGQELAVFGWLASMSKETEWQQEQFGTLLPGNTAEWLERVQTSVLAEGGGEDRQEEWVHWLCTALDSATQFRDEHATFTYDVSQEHPPLSPNGDNTVPVWTSRPAMQHILEEQLGHWKASPIAARTISVETVVQAALQSFGDSYAANPKTKHSFQAILQLAIPFLRSAKGIDNDQLAFFLSKTHNHFHGLCQIALDHEKMNDKEVYSLNDLFQPLAEKRDVDVDMLFGNFVLKWHTDRELFGHVMNYGTHCPLVLNLFMQTEPALRPYRWVHAIRQRDYNAATESLVSNVETGNPTLAEAKLALSLGKMAHQVMEHDESHSHTAGDTIIVARRLRIEQKRELVNAQEELFGTTAGEHYLWTPSGLVDYALDQLKHAEGQAEKIRFCFIGLAISASFESNKESHDHAAKVWLFALNADSTTWQNWLRTQTNLTNSELVDEALRDTVFGGLVQQADGVESWGEVVYGPEMERQVLEKMPSDDATGMRRLLRSLTPGRW